MKHKQESDSPDGVVTNTQQLELQLQRLQELQQRELVELHQRQERQKNIFQRNLMMPCAEVIFAMQTFLRSENFLSAVMLQQLQSQMRTSFGQQQNNRQMNENDSTTTQQQQRMLFQQYDSSQLSSVASGAGAAANGSVATSQQCLKEERLGNSTSSSSFVGFDKKGMVMGLLGQFEENNILKNELRTVKLEHAKLVAASSTDKPEPEMDESQQSRYWTSEEHALFLEATERIGFKDVKAIAAYVGTRNATQVRTHAQKYLLKMKSKKTPTHSSASGSTVGMNESKSSDGSGIGKSSSEGTSGGSGGGKSEGSSSGGGKSSDGGDADTGRGEKEFEDVT